MNEKKQIQDGIMFKISLLSISIFLMMAPAISPALTLMYKAFPDQSPAAVEELTTIPNIGIVVGLIVSPFLIKFFKEKITVLIGLAITLLAGTFPMYANAYTPILISRFLIGFGIGLFNSLAVSLIPKFYQRDEDELAQMIGFQNVMGTIGSALASFLISWLLGYGWHGAFAIYLLVIPVFLLFAAFVKFPQEETVVTTEKSAKKSSNKINSKVVLIAALMFLLFIFYMTMAFKLPVFAVQNGIMSNSTYSFTIGVLSLVGIPIGAAFGKIYKVLHDKIFPLGAFFTFVGFLGLALSTNSVVFIIFYILLTFGFGLMVPYMYNWLDWAAPRESINFATTIVLVLVNVGCSISPMVINWIQSLIGNSSAQMSLMVSAVFFGLFFIYALGHYLSVHRHHLAAQKDAADNKTKQA
ncbi:MFS transporter [Lactobacillus corticis]|uniref:Major facilitator superfamily transporter n=1 Tax=Lactobacillus corticis TaxID=2201249 RepID=A0A916QHH0_9LACO|nr:MFS transporter [Lactobacillus corticis]GFZ27455.1 major facilitator superfamily transporter [Lactobacillus corticis]